MSDTPKQPDALPELPASQAFSLTRSIYTADDMRDYARAALAAQAEKRAAERKRSHEDYVAQNRCIADQHDQIAALRAQVDAWQALYRRAINEANGLTNYVEDRPELRNAEKRLAAIEAAAHKAIDSASKGQPT